MKTDSSWRLSEELTRTWSGSASRKVSVSSVLDTAVLDWLKKIRYGMLQMTRRNGHFTPLRSVCLGVPRGPEFPAAEQPARRSLSASGGAMPATALSRYGRDSFPAAITDVATIPSSRRFHQLRLPLLSSEVCSSRFFHLWRYALGDGGRLAFVRFRSTGPR